MTDEILIKLQDFLEKHSSISNEADAIYLLVQIRKLLDREKDLGNINLFPTIRFYADWSLHTQKDKITDEIKNVMLKINKMIPMDKNPFHIKGRFDFIFMPELKNEMQGLLTKYNLPADFVSEKNWQIFVDTLIQILSNQPINNPIPSIKTFCYKPFPKGLILLEIQFTDQRGLFTLRNAH
ncbi:MAG TPA: hypothetical protein VMR59_01295 [Patescibacteria group bacterium]|jgi:hypothetical protein|nr:hypothetical protein [Patescibacteria group bacterium]